MLRIGLTGGIASGKSTVARLLRERGAVVIDADMLAREAVKPGTDAWQAIRDQFGPDYFLSDGSLDRARLGDRVFHDENARQTLNRIVHPAVRALIRERLEAVSERERQLGIQSLVVLDIPLLYEVGLENTVSEVWVAYCPDEVQVKRLMARDGLSHEQAMARIQSQMPLKDKAQRAHRVIPTDQPMDMLTQHLHDLLSQYRWDPIPA